MINICIVDDQTLIRDTISLIIEQSSAGMTILQSFSNAEAFVEEYDYYRPDLTLMDIDLPGMSGIEAISIITSKYPKAKFLVLTVFADDEKVFKALKAGAGGYLLKKHSYDYLSENINELLAGGAPMSPEIARKVIEYFSNNNESLLLNKLTDKEKIVLQMLVDGFLYKEIAMKLGVTIDAIKKHAHNIYEKLQVRTRSEAIKKYLS
jgi:DNA-binding NarL/FixJ family response regulator